MLNQDERRSNTPMITDENKTVILDVRVVPRSSRSEVVGTVEGVLKVRIASPPVDGAANNELIKLLSKHYGVPKSNIEIVSGQSSRSKRVRIILKSSDKDR